MRGVSLVNVGQRLRKARQAFHLSLQQVADRAHLSSATLSRIETSKQSLDLGVFLQLAEILHLQPADLLDGEGEGRERALAVAFSALTFEDRMGFWRELIDASKSLRVSRRQRGGEMRNLSMEIEELSVQIELMHEQLENLRKRLKNA